MVVKTDKCETQMVDKQKPTKLFKLSKVRIFLHMKFILLELDSLFRV